MLKLTGSGREQAAQEIWRPSGPEASATVLGAAVDAAVADKTMTAEEAVAAAERLHQDANEARGVARSEAWEQQREAGSVESRP